MNLAAGQAELMARGFDYLTPARLTIMLNNGKNAFEDQWRWPWLELTRTGTAPLAVSGLKHVYYVQDTDADNELLGLDVRQIAQGGTPVDEVGPPEYWWLDGPVEEIVTINTWPASSAALEARLVVDSPELSADSDTPLIPTRYHPLWIDFAVVEAYKDSDNLVGAQALRADIAMRVQDLILRYEVRNLQHAALNSVHHYSEDD